MPDQSPLTPDAAAIRADLAYMTARWSELPQRAQIEIRAFREGGTPQIGKFSPDDLDEAVDWVESLNGHGFNIYAVRNPVRHDCVGAASDEDIVAAFFLWADCDDRAPADNILKWEGPKYSASVKTGNTPSLRVHVYWALEAPCTDLEEWRATQTAIAAHFGSDRAVINPSRIMRVAGTVSYPDARKRSRGYEKELVTIRTEYADPRAPVTIEQMRRAFGQGAAPAIQIDTGRVALDRAQAVTAALSGQEWHNHVIRLVASYVARGMADEEIHRLTADLTLPGYTAADTRQEVQTAIDGARRKGWAPPEPPTIDLQAEPPAGAAGSLEWFDDIAPVLTDSYIVKGVIGQGAMSVVYGPSNSGKTFFALDLAFHIAAGLSWRGARVRQTPVLYLAAEGGSGVANRVAALKIERKARGIPFALRRAGLDLLHNEADLNTVYALAKEVMGNSETSLLIVVDTLSRVMAGADENAPADMTALIRNIDMIRAATGAHVMLVHHTGKDAAKGARGHSSLRAATDTEIEVQNEDGNRAAMVTKQRDYAGGETWAFTLKSVSLGHDQDGDEVVTCVVETADADDFEAARTQRKGLGGNQKIIADTFDQMLAEGLGKPNPAGVGMPERGQFWTVPLADLRDLSMGKMPSANKRTAFFEAWRALTDSRGLFCAALEMAWRVDRKVK